MLHNFTVNGRSEKKLKKTLEKPPENKHWKQHKVKLLTDWFNLSMFSGK